MKKTKAKMNKPICLGMSNQNISKPLMYDFFYDLIKPRYQYKAKQWYMDTGNFDIYLKTEDFYRDIANDVKKLFDTSNHDEDDKRPLPIGKNKKVIGLFKDELGGRIIKEFVGLRAKIYAHLMDNDTEHKKAKGTKKCVIKKRLMFKNYKDCQSNIKSHLHSNKDLKVIIIMYILNKSIRLH